MVCTIGFNGPISCILYHVHYVPKRQKLNNLIGALRLQVACTNFDDFWQQNTELFSK